MDGPMTPVLQVNGCFSWGFTSNAKDKKDKSKGDAAKKDSAKKVSELSNNDDET